MFVWRGAEVISPDREMDLKLFFFILVIVSPWVGVSNRAS